MDQDPAAIRQRVQRIKSLPTLPGVVNRLLAMVESENVTVSDIADIIATDQVITAKVLKIVNSPFYGFPGRITTINHALVLLGFNVIKGIVLSAAVLDYMTDSLTGLWEHSIGVATASGVIARALNAEEPEEISTAGLLHDLGKVILCVELPEDSRRVVAEAELSKISMLEAEIRQLDGITHCKIADWLATEWNLSPRLRDPIAHHHDPENSTKAPVPTAIVHLADVCTRALQFGSGGDPYVPQIHPAALDKLGLKIGDLVALIDRIDEMLEGIDTDDFS